MTSKQEKKITRLLETFDWMFGVQNYTRTLQVADEEEEGFEGVDMCCEIEIDELYKALRITLYPKFFRCSEKDMRKLLLHEFCHVITHHFKRLVLGLLNGELCTMKELVAINEGTTSIIENLLHKFLTDGGKHYKQAYKKYLEV